MTSIEAIRIIRKFLDLPATALPSADWIDSMGNHGAAWHHLRDYVRPYAQRTINHMGEVIRLKASRGEWRNGVIVTLD